MQTISEFIEWLDLPQKKERVEEAVSLLCGKHCPPDPRVKAMTQSIGDKILFLKKLSEMDDTPILKGLSKSLQALLINSTNPFFEKSEWLRFKVAITVQRGLYNCWDHDYPVIYQGKPTHPLIVFSEIFTILKKTLSLYQPFLQNKKSYELSGIYP